MGLAEQLGARRIAAFVEEDKAWEPLMLEGRRLEAGMVPVACSRHLRHMAEVRLEGKVLAQGRN